MRYYIQIEKLGLPQNDPARTVVEEIIQRYHQRTIGVERDFVVSDIETRLSVFTMYVEKGPLSIANWECLVFRNSDTLSALVKITFTPLWGNAILP